MLKRTPRKKNSTKIKNPTERFLKTLITTRTNNQVPEEEKK